MSDLHESTLTGNGRIGRRWLRRWLLGGSVAALILGVFWNLVEYSQRLLRQPPLRTLAHPPNSTTGQDEAILRAMAIAASNVRSGIEPRQLPDGQHKLVLCAGWRNFREPWARDFGFASFGLIELGELRALRQTLETFLIFQKPDGLFPVKIHSTSVVDRYIHSLFRRQQPTYRPLRPKHKTAHNTLSLDGNALVVIAALNYLRRVDDPDFARRHWPALKRGLTWLETQALHGDGLLHQGAFTDWADSVGREGIIHYTNVLYWKAVHEFARDAAHYGYHADEAYFAEKAHQLKVAINDHFWQPDLGYYSTSAQFRDILGSPGNLLAIAWGLAAPEQAQAILDNMAAAGMADPVPTQVTNREYGRAHIAIENRLAGIPHYHTLAAWLWLGAWHIVALTRTGRLSEAHELLARISHVINRDGIVHEVYGRDGQYLSTFLYTSEAPLTWSAGLLVYAHAVYRAAVARPATMPQNGLIGGNAVTKLA